MSERAKDVVTWFVAGVRALLHQDWLGHAGDTFRKATSDISNFADEHNVRPKDMLDEGVELGRRKLHGLANKEYADALNSFAEAEQKEIECEVQRRSLESRVRQEEAAARLAELNVLAKELELLKKLQETGTILHRDQNGNLTVLPIPADCDLMKLADQLRKRELVPST